MGAKNAFLAKLQTKQAASELVSVAEAIAQTQQAMLDSMMVTLGYGDCMKNDPWGEQRIMEAVMEVKENYNELVFPGISLKPDADAHRGKVDKLLEKKLPHHFIPWLERYPFWREETIEQEAERERKKRNRKKG